MQSFEWISSETRTGEYITIDSLSRLYLSSGAAKLLGITSWPAHVYVGYDKVNKRIIVGKAGVVRPANVQPYKFDERRYTYAKQFVARIGLTKADLPQRYVYVGRDHSVGVPAGAMAFQLEGYEAPDDAH
ncbi:MAG: hypothetical protein IRZ03_17235 [Acidobacterium ailaaui]|nr:hypothetical protein [Pseudacidobacterium ailaaui]